MSKRLHRWMGDTCLKCGLMREKKTFKQLMAVVNHPPWEVYEYTERYVYWNGIGNTTTKRPDCKRNH